MSHVDKFREFVNAVQNGDTKAIEEIVSMVTDDKNTTIIKCVSCGEIISFEKTRQLFLYAAGNIPPALNYRVLKHILEDSEHNIAIPMAMGLSFPLSQMIEARLRSHCKKGDNGVEVDYDTWFPSYVERWRIKAGED